MRGTEEPMQRRDLFRSAARDGPRARAGRRGPSAPRTAGANRKRPATTSRLMNTALALEHQAIWAYGLAGQSGLLSAKAKEVGLAFQGSHEIHRDLLVDAVKRKGGAPVEREEGLRLRRAARQREGRPRARVQARGRRRARRTSTWWTGSRTARSRAPPRRSSPTRSSTRRCCGASSDATSCRRSG